MKQRKKKGVSPLLAVGLLLIGGTVAGKTLFDLAGGQAAVPVGPVEIVADPEADGSTGSRSTGDAETIRWPDLLAQHGSFDDRDEVRVAFSVLEEARFAMPAPAGETAGGTASWEGQDPPQLALGVVMISDRARRAVLGGRVVGVGEEVGGVVVQSIARDRVVTRWASRLLTYDLENGWPREFRAELDRRRRDTQSVSDGAAAAEQKVQDVSPQEIQK